MRRLALACAVLLVALALLRQGARAARARAPGVAPIEAEERAPAEAERRGAEGPAGENDALAAPAVRLLADGSILFDGRAASLKALQGACAGKGAVPARIDESTSWWHAELVLAALQRAGVRRVRLDLPDGPVEICFDSPYWRQDARHVVGGHTAGVIAIESRGMDEPDLERQVAAEARRIETECRLRPLGEVVAVVETEWPTFGRMARGLRALRGAGVEIELHFDWLEGELPDETRLPPPPEPPWSFTGHWPRCACRPGVVALELPFAAMAERGRHEEEDCRLTFQLDRHGTLFEKDEIGLEDFAGVLRRAKERWDREMKQVGRSGLEKLEDGTVLSKVYVRIAADRSAPARQVGWILHVLKEEGFYRVAFAVAGDKEPPRGPCVTALDRRLTQFLPAGGARRSLVGPDEPTVLVYVDPLAYGVDATGGLDADGLPEALRRAVARADGSRKLVVGLHVAAGIEWGRVIAAIDAIASAGIVKVVFADLPPPDAAARQAIPLPR